MKYSLLLSKQGLLLRFIGLIFQSIIFLPLSFLISFFVSSITLEYYDFDSIKVFVTIIVVLNVICFVRNSFVKVTDNQIIMQNFICGKTIVNLNNISSVKIISSKELMKICRNRTGVDPLISNCFSAFIPMGNTVYFKNECGRDVVIGVWNVQKLYALLIEKVASDEYAPICDDAEVENELKSKSNSYGNLRCFVKMPLKNHILVFFSHFYETILLPIFMVLIFMWLFHCANIEVNRYFWIVPCLLISAFRYYRIIRVIVDPASKTIKLNLYNNDDKNVIKYDSLKNLCKHSQLDISKLNNRYSEIICSVPYSNKIKNPIVFEIANNKFVVLSVDKSQELYDLIRSTGDGLCTEA